MTPLRLNGIERGHLRDALRAAFRRSRFEELLEYRLDRSLDDYAAPADDYPTALRKVVEQANAELWWRDLLREARNVVPGDPALIAFAETYGAAPHSYAPGAGRLDGPQLELRVKAAQSTYDVATWRRRMGEIEARVCRVEWPEGAALGTGFLVAPALVLTNYHVIEPIGDDGSAVRLRFDYKVDEDGVSVGAGTAYGLAADWRADVSGYSRRDFEAAPASDPAPDELDYALLRVAGAPGHDPVGGPTKDEPTPRGWIELPLATHAFTAQPALYIVQHPLGQPLQVALDSDAVIGVNANGTRVRYTTTTEPGSSGSPCFGPDWDWVALHHAGDPKYQLGEAAEFNQGIPLPAIVALLEARGKLGLLGSGP